MENNLAGKRTMECKQNKAFVSVCVFVTMDPAAFDELLELVTPLIKRRDTWLRDAIPAVERLSLTLRF